MKYNTCPICDKSIDSLNYSRHYNRCSELKRLTPEIINAYVNENVTLRELHIKYGSHFDTLRQLLIDNGIHIRTSSEVLKLKYSTHPQHKHSDETKLRMSINRKKYLKDNPDKHPWKRNSKFTSVPCETIKQRLTENNISFIAEYTPNIDRNFSIDIAFPDVKVGIEINGNQHYNRDGSLKPYYQSRHNAITEAGWKLFEYHYSMVYDEAMVTKIVDSLKCDYNLGSIDYSFYIKDKKKHLCVDGCGSIVSGKGCRCVTCCYLHRRVVERPSYQQLLIDTNEMSICAVGRKYGVSDNAVRRWLKKYQKSY